MNDSLICLVTLLTFWTNDAITFITQHLLSLLAFQFIAITDYNALRFSKDKRHHTPSTTQLQFIG